MKKIIVTLLAVAMILSCTLVFSSCSLFAPKPELEDLEDVAEVLEDEDYMAAYSDDEDELGIGVSERLTAVNEDGDSLTIIVYEDKKLASFEYDEMKRELDTAKKELKEQIKYYEYLLKEYEDDMEDEQVEFYEEGIEEAEEQLEQMEEAVVGKSGSTVWYGTKTAIEDSKG